MHYKGIAYALILIIVIAFARIALWSKSAINQPVLKETSFNNAYYKFAINASSNLSSTATVLVVDGVHNQSTQLPYTFIFGLGTGITTPLHKTSLPRPGMLSMHSITYPGAHSS